MSHILKCCVIVYLFILLVLSKDDSINQHDYIPKLERIDLISHDEKEVTDVQVKTFKYNRTTTAVNITVTILADIEDDLEVILQAYRFASNEYRLFPVRFQVKACDALRNNLFGVGVGFKECGNFTGCPLKKGTILHICHFTPDESKFPPLVPNGRYRVDLEFFHDKAAIALAYVYVEIVRPIKGRR